jgi:hypothetical protein
MIKRKLGVKFPRAFLPGGENDGERIQLFTKKGQWKI